MIDYLKTWLELNNWIELRSDKRAVTALEYALIAALVAGAIVTAVTLLGTNLSTKFTTVAGYVK